MKIGNLKDHVLTDADSFPLPAARVAEAVRDPKDPYTDTAVIFSHPKPALPLVRETYQKESDGAKKLQLAQLLAFLGDPAGLDTMIDAVRAAEKLDKGWHYRGMGQFGSCMSPLDGVFYALGQIGDRKATPALVEKLERLQPGTEFSHFRALAWALDRIGDPAAADALAEVLSREGIRGQAAPEIQDAIAVVKEHPSWTAEAPRANALRELFLARALFRCGDKDGLGRKVLEEYARDVRGHFAKHAAAVLESAK